LRPKLKGLCEAAALGIANHSDGAMELS